MRCSSDDARGCTNIRRKTKFELMCYSAFGLLSQPERNIRVSAKFDLECSSAFGLLSPPKHTLAARAFTHFALYMIDGRRNNFRVQNTNSGRVKISVPIAQNSGPLSPPITSGGLAQQQFLFCECRRRFIR